MQCPQCASTATKVVDSRTIEDGKATRRRRKCEKCDYRFTTFERLELSMLIVQKSDGTSEPYSREKLERGIWLSCGKLPITHEDIDGMIARLQDIWMIKKNITTKQLGLDVMNALKNINDIAYIRFASVYREFRDVEDFQAEIQKIFEKK